MRDTSSRTGEEPELALLARVAATRAALVIVAAGGLWAIARVYEPEYAVREWFLVRELTLFALVLYWALGCTAVGLAILGLTARARYRLDERAVLGFALGVLAFALGIFLAGVAGRLDPWLFLGAPAACLAVGSRALLRFGRAMRRYAAVARRRHVTTVDLLALCFGAVGLVAVYVPLLAPSNAQHDALWYHLPLAQDYAAQHAITRFPNGWFMGAYPQLASLLYVWPWLHGGDPVEHLDLAAHLEFGVFVATLAGIPPLVRRLVPGVRVPHAWAGVFLFPGIFAYDAGLSLGADHVAALFAVPMLLALRAALRAPDARHAGLVGVFAGAAALTKYSAICLYAPALVGLALSGGVFVLRRRTARAWAASVRASATAAAAFVVVTSPHWLKNWIWYGDPLYPTLYRHLRGRPWNAAAERYFELFLRQDVWQPARTWQGVMASLKTSLTLGFEVHEFGFHRNLPTFGFLFAITLFCLPFIGAPRRLWGAYGFGVAGAFVWCWTNQHDRYLQALVPWLAAATVAALGLAFRSRGLVGRIVAAALVTAQVSAAAGLVVMPVHQMALEHNPIVAAVARLKDGYERRYGRRYEPSGVAHLAAMTAFARRLSARSRVLVHEVRFWVGLNAPVLTDEARWQGGIRWEDHSTPLEIDRAMNDLGLTHVVTGGSAQDSSHGIVGTIVFWDYVTRYCKEVQKKDGLTLWRVPARPPAAGELGPVLILSTGHRSPAPGLYDLRNVASGPARELVDPSDDAGIERLTDLAAFLTVDRRSKLPERDVIQSRFVRLAEDDERSYFRKR